MRASEDLSLWPASSTFSSPVTALVCLGILIPKTSPSKLLLVLASRPELSYCDLGQKGPFSCQQKKKEKKVAYVSAVMHGLLLASLPTQSALSFSERLAGLCGSPPVLPLSTLSPTLEVIQQG